MLRVFGHRTCVGTCWVLLAQIWPFSNLSQQLPTCRNTSQHGGQTHATCFAQQFCDMSCWHVAIVWSGLRPSPYSSLGKVENPPKTRFVFKENHMYIAAFSTEIFTIHTKINTQPAFQIPRFEERFRKAPFSWRISVDGRLNRRNKAAWTGLYKRDYNRLWNCI